MKKNYLIVSVLVYAVFFLSLMDASAETKYLKPSADAWLDTANPTTPHPAGDLRLYYNNAAWQYSAVLLKFDLSSIPANSTINTAELNFVAKTCSGSNDAFSYAKRVTATWAEDTATWQVMQNRVTATDMATNTGTICAFESNFVYNVKSIVQAWVNASVSNYGFRIDPDTDVHAPSFDHNFFDRAGVAYPNLFVNYSPPATPSGTTGAGTTGATSEASGSNSGNQSSSTGTNSTNNSNTTDTNPDGTPITAATDTTSVGSSSVVNNPTTTILDIAKNPTKLFSSGWPWWKKALAIWAALMLIVVIAGGIFLIVKKIRKKGAKVD